MGLQDIKNNYIYMASWPTGTHVYLFGLLSWLNSLVWSCVHSCMTVQEVRGLTLKTESLNSGKFCIRFIHDVLHVNIYIYISSSKRVVLTH